MQVPALHARNASCHTRTACQVLRSRHCGAHARTPVSRVTSHSHACAAPPCSATARYGLYCIFDGHSGALCADYCAKHLLELLHPLLPSGDPPPLSYRAAYKEWREEVQQALTVALTMLHRSFAGVGVVGGCEATIILQVRITAALLLSGSTVLPAHHALRITSCTIGRHAVCLQIMRSWQCAQDRLAWLVCALTAWETPVEAVFVLLVMCVLACAVGLAVDNSQPGQLPGGAGHGAGGGPAHGGRYRCPRHRRLQRRGGRRPHQPANAHPGQRPPHGC